jgi:hypothetical protein
MKKTIFIALLIFITTFPSLAQNCAADYGTVFPPEGIAINVCPGGISGTFGISGNNTSSDYSSVWVVANTSGDIAFINNGNSINFGVLPAGASGAFTVHALNIRSTDLSLLQTALDFDAINTLSDLQTAIANNQFCAELQAQGTTLQVAEPINIDYEVICHPETGQYDVVFNISGGITALLNDPSIAYYEYSGLISANSISPDLGTSFIVIGLYNGNSFTLLANDNVCPSVPAEATEVDMDCGRCQVRAGTMPTTNLVMACGSDLHLAGAVDADDVTNLGDILYVIHTNPDADLGDVLAIDEDYLDGYADFSGSLPTGAEYGVTYYVSSVASNVNLNTGLFDWQSECLRVAVGTPIVFQPPIVMDYEFTCNDNGTNALNVFFTGENSPYSVSGDIFSGIYYLGNVMDTTNIALGNYGISAMNTQGCLAHFDLTLECISATAPTRPAVEQLRIVPQPASANANLQFSLQQSQQTQISIFDLMGKLLYTQTIWANAGINTVPLDLSAYASGLYLLQISNMDGSVTAKLSRN